MAVINVLKISHFLGINIEKSRHFLASSRVSPWQDREGDEGGELWGRRWGGGENEFKQQPPPQLKILTVYFIWIPRTQNKHVCFQLHLVLFLSALKRRFFFFTPPKATVRWYFPLPTSFQYLIRFTTMKHVFYRSWIKEDKTRGHFAHNGHLNYRHFHSITATGCRLDAARMSSMKRQWTPVTSFSKQLFSSRTIRASFL